LREIQTALQMPSGRGQIREILSTLKLASRGSHPTVSPARGQKRITLS